VHHASAALGTARYLLKGGLWQPLQTFVWELRERTFTPQAEAARAAYLKSKGWLANNMNTGTQGIFEFKIAQRFLKGETVPLAVAFASDPASPQYWPQTLADDCRKRELIFGSSPADLKFNRESWAKLELQDNLAYILPFPVGKSYELIQGNNGPYGHQGHSAYAFDFVMPIGSAVTAAREGIVVKTEGRFVDGNRKPGEENYVFIQHDDSTFARYYHLTQNGPRVKVGDRVARGDTIGLSGNTGASAGPHLHFDATKGCPEWGCQTVPIVFANANENPLQQGKIYKAEPLTKNKELK
jgi:murein DD-endopeptidase MepM/ murein hydrolase activator NlpD